MPSLALSVPDHMQTPRMSSRGDLVAFLMELCADVLADSYMLVAVVNESEGSSARILASNWIHDAIELVGRDMIAKLARLPAAAPGQRPRSLLVSPAPDMPEILGAGDATLLDVLGHRELYAMAIQAGSQRYYLLLSSEHVDGIARDKLTGAQMRCGYRLSGMTDLPREAAASTPLSERERECLLWVSEGKTTEEVALILGVSANTVNNYVTSAIQKLSASNRAMAIATAIRSGII